MTERVAIFDENYNKIGEALRDEVHACGYWHAVFHCWVIEKWNNEWLIYLQLRSEHKKDYLSQFDISAASFVVLDNRV